MCMEEYLLVLKLTVYLILIVLLVYLALRFGLRRFQPGQGPGCIRIVQKVPLDIKGTMSLVVIHVGEKALLLGVSPGSITVLRELTQDDLKVIPQAHTGSETFAGIFSRIVTGYKDKISSGKGGS